MTAKVKAKLYENAFFEGKSVRIFRIPWIHGQFYKLISKPALEFLYLSPGLFIFTPILLSFSNITIIHAHGLIAGFIGIFWGKLFRKKVFVSFHSIYSFPQNGLYTKFVKLFLKRADGILCLSNQSVEEFRKLGLEKKRIHRFTYWVDSQLFNSGDPKTDNKNFTLLFVGRLIEEKGITILLDASSKFDKKVRLSIIGTGPLEQEVEKISRKQKNISYLGKKSQKELPFFYSQSDMLIVPSVHEEGFGRVILEALWCGVPVLGSRRGAIPEAIDESVGKLIDISEENIIKWVNYFAGNSNHLNRLKKNTIAFAKKNYSEKNVEEIIRIYTT